MATGITWQGALGSSEIIHIPQEKIAASTSTNAYKVLINQLKVDLQKNFSTQGILRGIASDIIRVEDDRIKRKYIKFCYCLLKSETDYKVETASATMSEILVHAPESRRPKYVKDLELVTKDCQARQSASQLVDLIMRESIDNHEDSLTKSILFSYRWYCSTEVLLREIKKRVLSEAYGPVQKVYMVKFCFRLLNIFPFIFKEGKVLPCLISVASVATARKETEFKEWGNKIKLRLLNIAAKENTRQRANTLYPVGKSDTELSRSPSSESILSIKSDRSSSLSSSPRAEAAALSSHSDHVRPEHPLSKSMIIRDSRRQSQESGSKIVAQPAPGITSYEVLKQKALKGEIDAEALKQIALDLKLEEMRRFLSITVEDLIEQNSTPKPPRIASMLALSNTIVDFIQNEVEMAKTQQDKICICNLWFEIAAISDQLNDQHTALTIVTVLDSNYVVSKFAKHLLGSSKEKTFEALKQKYAPSGNFLPLRNEIDKILDLRGHCVPHIGIFLRDLTLDGEGNKRFIEGKLNINRLDVISKIYYKFYRLQYLGRCEINFKSDIISHLLKTV